MKASLMGTPLKMLSHVPVALTLLLCCEVAKRVKMEHLKAMLLWCVTVLVLRASCKLTYSRVGNKFTLTCDIQKATTDYKPLRFWINDTEKLDIERTLNTTQLQDNMILFELVPQYEGTFYCGYMDEEKISNGIGPFAANPKLYSANNASYDDRICITSFGGHVTLQCPIKLGSLLEAYHVAWKFNTILGPLPEHHHVVGSTKDLFPALVIANIQMENIGYYTCTVNVTSPYDRHMWTISRTIQLAFEKHDVPVPENYAIPYSVIAIANTSLIIILIAPILVAICTISGTKRKGHFLSKVDMKALSPCTSPVKEREQRRHGHPNISYSHDFLQGCEFDYECLQIKQDHSIGSGTIGTVFEAQYKGAPCALKLLNNHAEELTTGFDCTTNNIEEDAHKSFIKECKLLQSLEHKNIVRHLYTFIHPKSNLPMLIMEMMECSLKTYLHKQQYTDRLSVRCQTSLCLDIAEGLNYLHSKKIIHRDLCDENVLLKAQDGAALPQAKIADFNMSRFFHSDYMSVTLSTLGHRDAYFPAEVHEDPYHYWVKSDVYSFGVIAAQIVTLKTLIRGKEDLTNSVEKTPESYQLKNMILQCCCEDRNARLDSAGIIECIKSATK